MHKTFLMSFSDKRDYRQTDGQRYNGTDRHTFTPLDKRYSPIISSICGPNNIQNTDQECFKRCIARSDYLNSSHNERVSREEKEHAEKYDWIGIKFLISIRQIDRFEKQNNVSVNVYVNEGVSFYPF